MHQNCLHLPQKFIISKAPGKPSTANVCCRFTTSQCALIAFKAKTCWAFSTYPLYRNTELNLDEKGRQRETEFSFATRQLMFNKEATCLIAPLANMQRIMRLDSNLTPSFRVGRRVINPTVDSNDFRPAALFQFKFQ